MGMTCKRKVSGDKVNVMRYAPFTYEIQSEELLKNSANNWAHCKVVEQKGITTITPFRKNGSPRTPSVDRTICATKNGSLTMSPGGQKIVARISLDRGQDSPEEFVKQLKSLLGDDYLNKVINFELESCSI